jgi:hypothetical protein
MMHGPMSVKSPNNISKWQMGFNSAFKGFNCQSSKFTFRCHTLGKEAACKEILVSSFFPQGLKRPWRKAERSPYLPPRLRMNGVMPPLHHIPS